MHRVEHIETLLDEDLPRFADLGSPPRCSRCTWTASIERRPNAWFDGLAPGRARTRLALRGHRSQGAVLALGSDWMVADYDPRVGMALGAAAARAGRARAHAVPPEQALSAARTLAGYTTCPAAITGDGERAGRLAPGRNADITVLGANPLDVAPDDLPDVPVVLTVVDGAIVHRGR